MKRLLFLTTLLCFASDLRTFASTESAQPLPDLTKLLAETDSLAVFEGIPRSYPDLKSSEPPKLRNEPRFTVARQFFYENALPLTDEKHAALETIFRGETPVKAYRGRKLCGGFNADFMIEWRRENQPVLRALICFGCGEIRFVDGATVIETDMTKQAQQRLDAVLGTYRPVQTSPAAEPTAPAPVS